MLFCFTLVSCKNSAPRHGKMLDIYVHNPDSVSYQKTGLYLEDSNGNLQLLTKGRSTGDEPTHFSVSNDRKANIVIRLVINSQQPKEFALSLPIKDSEFHLYIKKDENEIILVSQSDLCSSET